MKISTSLITVVILVFTLPFCVSTLVSKYDLQISIFGSDTALAIILILSVILATSAAIYDNLIKGD
ncbi:hypothetical protein [Paraglaciecola sp. 20A4]|uniref:hypothetical protein n=1 Tax=Paraglaciecola sp. 20A4 TaxID=2687288 RepID=UPI00140C8BC2|nr:hypothetical protein [Paraglaciecola sp. 20A4]